MNKFHKHTKQIIEQEIQQLDADIKSLTRQHKQVKVFENISAARVAQMYRDAKQQAMLYYNISSNKDYNRRKKLEVSDLAKFIYCGSMLFSMVPSITGACLFGTSGLNTLLNLTPNLAQLDAQAALALTLTLPVVAGVGAVITYKIPQRIAYAISCTKEDIKYHKLETYRDILEKVHNHKQKGEEYSKVLEHKINQKNIKKQSKLKELAFLNAAQSSNLQLSPEQ